MHPSTPSPDPRGDSRNNPTDPTDRYGDVDRHGDVDTSGDLVDELAQKLPVAELGRGLSERERAELRNRLARTLLGLPQEPAAEPAQTHPAAAEPPPRRPSRPRPTPKAPTPPKASKPSAAAEQPDLVEQLEQLIPSESPLDVHAHARNVANVVQVARSREHHFNAELFAETMYTRLGEARRPWTVRP